MLAADKLQLQSAMKQQAVSLKEKEFNLHHSNFMTVGTQAAVLAGLDITMLIEFSPRDAVNHEYNRLLQLIYYTMMTAAFCMNLRVVAQTTMLSVLGASLALRGPDGSMMVATDALYQERRIVFGCFAFGLALTIAAVLVAVGLMLHWEAALACQVVATFSCYQLYSHYARVQRSLYFDERDTVDFTDLFSFLQPPGVLPRSGYINGATTRRKTASKNTNEYEDDDEELGLHSDESTPTVESMQAPVRSRKKNRPPTYVRTV